MKVSVRVRGEWLQIPCKDGKNTIKWLGQEAWKRYEKLIQAQRNVEDGLSEKVSVQEVRKTRGGAILDPDDAIIDVLDNDDFVNIGSGNISPVLIASLKGSPDFMPIDHSW